MCQSNSSSTGSASCWSQPVLSWSPRCCSPCEVDLAAGTSIAALLVHSSSLTSLALHNQLLHPLGLSCIALAAARSSSLTSLSLRGSDVGDQVGTRSTASSVRQGKDSSGPPPTRLLNDPCCQLRLANK